MARNRLALFAFLAALVLGGAWLTLRRGPAPAAHVDPSSVADVIDTRGAEVELASVPETARARAVEVPREAARSTSKFDPTATQKRATYTLTGRVVDDRGVALESFVIRADPAGEDVEGRRYATDKFQDSSGAYRLPGVTDGEWSVRATDDLGLVSAPQTVVMPRDARRAFDFVVPRPASISGRVVDADGTPAGGALVEAKQVVDDVETALRSVTSEADGTFRLAGVPAVAVVLTARRKDRSSSAPMDVVLHPGSELADIVLALRRAGAVEGTLVDGNQRPRSDIEVSIVRTDDPMRRRTSRTDRSGRFRFDDIEPGTYTVMAPQPGGAAGVLSANAQVESERVTFVDLGSGPPTRILVRGVVRADRTGVRAEVSFCPVGIGSRTPGLNWDRTSRASSSLAGEYELHLAVAGTFVVEAIVPGLAKLTRSVEIADAPQQVVDLEFGTAGIRGWVLGPGGLPLGTVTVSAVPLAMPAAVDTGDGPVTRADVAAATDGSYEIRGLTAGTYTLAAVSGGESSMQDFGLASAVIEGLVLGAGERREGVNLRIERSGSVRVLVLDAKGKPAKRANVSAGSILGNSLATDDAGIAALDGLPPGEIMLTATTVDECTAQPTRVVVISGRAVDATIRLVLGGRFTVRLARRDGSPVVDPSTASITVRDARGEARAASYFLEAGIPVHRHIGFGPLPPGTYTVQARLGSRIAEERVAVAPGSDATLVLREPD